MAPRPPSDEELTRFGMRPEDEGAHDFDPEVEGWNESWFFDWFDAAGEVAGHCRVGLHPNQRRAWLWYYHFERGEWIAVEAPRLPLADVRVAAPGDAAGGLAYDRFGLAFSWQPTRPLRAGRLRVEGFGRVLSGPRAGAILPVGADLAVEATGAAHSLGRAQAAGHASERHPASRFEQPIALEGRLRAGGVEKPFSGRGERDHSWGPRSWNLEWTFLVLSGDTVRMQCAEARIPGLAPLSGGYLMRETSASLREVRFELAYHDDVLARPVSGRFGVVAEDATRLAGELDAIDAAEIDITHAFVPPRRSIYRRALVRARCDDGRPLLGWCEFNRFADRI
jgi:hypothetical protein